MFSHMQRDLQITPASIFMHKYIGKVVVPKMAVPKMGYLAICLDTENNTFGIWETDESAK